jgi:hypothetical protein
MLPVALTLAIRSIGTGPDYCVLAFLDTRLTDADGALKVNAALGSAGTGAD